MVYTFERPKQDHQKTLMGNKLISSVASFLTKLDQTFAPRQVRNYLNLTTMP